MNAVASVSVVVPVKASQNTIRNLCRSLLDQSVKPAEIILVGDPGDPSWTAIGDLIAEKRVKILEVRRPDSHFGRDSNLKRREGCAAASGDIIAVTDSDMEMPADWIHTGIELIRHHGVDSVAGVMVSPIQEKALHKRFLDHYTDRSYPAKTPRFPHKHILEKKNFGKTMHLPISANWFFTRTAYEKAGGFDPAFSLSYEDYSFAWQMVSSGCRILCTRHLWGYHHHRHHIRPLFKEYVKSGRGCATFMVRYPQSPLSQKRLGQILAVVFSVVAGIVGLLFWPGGTLVFGIAAYCALAALNVVHSGGVGFAFPAISLILGLGFTYGAVRGLIVGGRVSEKDQHFVEMNSGKRP